MSAFHDNALMGASGQQGYQISRSVRLRSSASAYLNRTPASAGNRKTWTWSGWVKRGILNSSGAVAYPLFAVPTGTTDSTWFEFRFVSDFLYVGGYSTNWRITSQVFRDPSAWYHIVLTVDTTQATANDRLKLYVNGTQVTTFSTTNNPTQNADLGINQASATYIGLSNSQYLDGYLTEINFIDGQALTPSSFGENDTVTGVWKPKKYAGTYGTNGFYLNFSDNSNNTAATIGKDYSGNGNNWTPNNISVTSGVTYDSMIDVPTNYADGGNGRGNYCTLNPLQPASTTVVVPTDGNLKMTGTASGNNVTGTMAIQASTYFEGTVITGGGTLQFGIRNLSTSNTYVYDSSGNKVLAGTSTAYGASFTTNDVIGVAVDPVNLTLQFFKNGTSQGTITSAFPSGDYVPFFYASNTNASAVNFGQRPFSYTPPTGFNALNTQNLPDATIKKGNQYFDVSTWTGNQTSRTITNSGAFQPDFIWTKSRSDAESHRLHDAVRGGNGSVLYELNSNETSAEGTDTLVSGFASNGFTIASGANSPNVTGRTYVGWQWKESAASGFDIVTYTGDGTTNRTVAHSLGVTPAMVIVKARSGAENWAVYHRSLSTGNFLFLNTTNAVQSPDGTFNSSTPVSSTQVQFGSPLSSRTNGNGVPFVMYLFSEVAGFSRMGSFTGNGSSDGPFLYCGFRPRWIMVKRTDTSGYYWWIVDTARNTYNALENAVYAQASDAETTGWYTDSLANGFKIRNSGLHMNASGGTYIYAAFAENPFKNALAR